MKGLYNRREFLAASLQGVAGVALIVALPRFASWLLPVAHAEVHLRLSVASYEDLEREGTTDITSIEGVIPAALRGTLYRVGPGNKVKFGHRLNHLFDGDAMVAAFRFGDGSVSVQTRFIQTPTRVREQKESQMLFHEFGTAAPPPAREFQNQPNINLLPWRGKLLALSEGGHPARIDAQTLAFEGWHDFEGSLPADVSFTAHPRRDARTGETFAYGLQQGMGMELKVYRLDETTGRATELYSLPQSRFPMIHDFILTAQHIVFIVPPVSFDILALATGRAPISDHIKFDARRPTQIIILRRDGAAAPVTASLPASMVFHHGNGWEDQDGRIVFVSCLGKDGSVLNYLSHYADPQVAPGTPGVVLRLTVNPSSGEVVSQSELGQGEDFPNWDRRYTGYPLDSLFTLAIGNGDDRLAARAVVRHNLSAGTRSEAAPDAGHNWGEALFVPRAPDAAPGDGYLVMMGYSENRRESFVEIRDALGLKFCARVWAGQRVPLGFHGVFC